jgi:uroporphyrinogen-III decarboxylase
VIVSPGCEVPPDAPDANLRALVNAARAIHNPDDP